MNQTLALYLIIKSVDGIMEVGQQSGTNESIKIAEFPASKMACKEYDLELEIWLDEGWLIS